MSYPPARPGLVTMIHHANQLFRVLFDSIGRMPLESSFKHL